MKGLHLDIVSPDKKIFNGGIDSVILPSTLGSPAALPKHAPIVSLLKAGVLPYVTKDGGEHVQGIHGGFVEMDDNEAPVCVD